MIKVSRKNESSNQTIWKERRVTALLVVSCLAEAVFAELSKSFDKQHIEALCMAGLRLTSENLFPNTTGIFQSKLIYSRGLLES